MTAHSHIAGGENKQDGVSRAVLHTPYGTVIVQEYTGMVDIIVTHKKGIALTYTPPDDNKGQTASVTLCDTEKCPHAVGQKESS